VCFYNIASFIKI